MAPSPPFHVKHVLSSGTRREGIPTATDMIPGWCPPRVDHQALMRSARAPALRRGNLTTRHPPQDCPLFTRPTNGDCPHAREAHVNEEREGGGGHRNPWPLPIIETGQAPLPHLPGTPAPPPALSSRRPCVERGDSDQTDGDQMGMFHVKHASLDPLKAVMTRGSPVHKGSNHRSS